MSTLFDIGLSGLSAASNAMYLTANNIANANNPFYARRVVDFVEVGTSLFGAGVTLGDVHRISNAFIDNQLMASKIQTAKTSTLSDSLMNLQSFIDNDQTSVTKFINASYEAIQSLNGDTTSVQGRTFYLNSLANMSNRINTASASLHQEYSNTEMTLTQGVTQINSMLNQIADLNLKIKSQGGDQILSLYDQKDQLLDSLAQMIEFTTQDDGFGGTRILLSNGMPLLEGTQVSSLSVTRSQTVPNGLDITATNSGSNPVITSIIGGGTVAGLLEYANTNLTLLQNKLNKLAIGIAYNMNAQNRLGVDAHGKLGGNIFNDVNDSSVISNRYLPNSDNLGSMSMGVLINDPASLTDSNYRLTFDSPGHYSLLRSSDNTVVSDGIMPASPTQISVDGFTLDISSYDLQVGDSYFIYPTLNAAANLRVDMISGSELALGYPVTASGSNQNQGNGQISVSAILDTTNASFSVPQALNPPLTIQFITSTTYRIVNANDNSIIEDNIPYSNDQGIEVFPTPGGYDPGYRIHLSGSMQAGDSFFVNYNSEGSGDNRNGMLLAKQYSEGTLDSGSLNFTSAYQEMIFALSTATNSALNNYKADNMLLSQLQSVRDVTSAVSLEEETMNLSRLQDSYLANTQVLQAAKSTMESIFALFRG